MHPLPIRNQLDKLLNYVKQIPELESYMSLMTEGFIQAYGEAKTEDEKWTAAIAIAAMACLWANLKLEKQ